MAASVMVSRGDRAKGGDRESWYPSLTGLRGIAALLIVLYHVYKLGGFHELGSLLEETVGAGGTLVSLFFMISGFSLFCANGSLPDDRFSLRDFYKKRFVRIVPAFYLAMGCYLVVDYMWCGHVVRWEEIVGTMTMMFVHMPTGRTSIVMAGWFVGVIVFLYLLYPLLRLWSRTFGSSLACVSVAVLLEISYRRYYFTAAASAGDLNVNVIVGILPFTLGILAVYLLRHAQKRTLFARIGLGCVIFLAAIGWHGGWRNEIVYLACYFAWLLLFALTPMKFLSPGSLLGAVGECSYEVYLLHMFVFSVLYNVGVLKWVHDLAISEAWQYFLISALMVGPTVLLAMLCHKSIAVGLSFICRIRKVAK